MNLTHFRSSLMGRSLSALTLLVFISTTVCPSEAQAQLNAPASLGLSLPVPSLLAPSEAFLPTVIKGLRIDPQNVLQFNFIVDTGDTGIKGEALKNESTKLIKYFLAALTTPDKDMWVNLSPTEKDRIIPDGLGSTEMGRDLLSQDYLLKQLTASLMYPESELGERFWKKIYAQVKEQFGTTELPVNMLNKVWIVPDKALVCEHEETAFVVEKHLKVMLEEEYLNSDKWSVVSGKKDDKNNSSLLTTYHLPLTTKIIKEILLPAIEHEVNTGRNFAQLRQIYNSMILATWYKRRLKESLLGQLYVDKNKTKGIDLEDKEAKYKIYNQYLEAFKKGAYNYIKEDYDPVAQEVVARKYISGGLAYDPAIVAIVPPEKLDQAQLAEVSGNVNAYDVEGFYLENTDPATLAEEQAAVKERDMREFEEKIVRIRNLNIAFQILFLIEPGIYGRVMKFESSPIAQLFLDLESERNLIVEEIGGTTPTAKYVLKDFGQKEGIHTIFMWQRLIYDKMITIPRAVALITEGSESAWLREFNKDTFFKDITVDANGRYDVNRFVNKVATLANRLSSSRLFEQASNDQLWEKVKKVRDTVTGTWEKYNVPDILTREHVVLREDFEKGKAVDTDAASLSEDEKKLADTLQLLQTVAKDIKDELDKEKYKEWIEEIEAWYNAGIAKRLAEISDITDQTLKEKAFADLRKLVVDKWAKEMRQKYQYNNAFTLRYSDRYQNRKGYFIEDDGSLFDQSILYDLIDKFGKSTSNMMMAIDLQQETETYNKKGSTNTENAINTMMKSVKRFNIYYNFLEDVLDPLRRTIKSEEIGSEHDGFPQLTYKNFLIPLQQNHPNLLEIARQGKKVKELSGIFRHELGNIVNLMIGWVSISGKPELEEMSDEYSELDKLWRKFIIKSSDSDVEVGEAFILYQMEMSKWSKKVISLLDPDYEFTIAIKRSLDFLNRFLPRIFSNEMKYEKANLSDLIESSKSLLKYYSYSSNGLSSEATKKEISFKKEIDETVDEQSFDKLRLMQVLMNLFKNAVEAMPEGGTLTVKTEAVGDGERFRIVVADTGKGMTPEVLENIFDMGFTTKANEGGSGIGSALNKQYIEAMGGTISVKSTVGVGSTFTIELPIRRITPESVVAPQTRQQPGDAAMNSFSNPERLAQDREQKIKDYTIILGDIVEFGVKKKEPALAFLDSEQKIAEVAQEIVETNNPINVLFGSLEIADQRRLSNNFSLLLMREDVNHKEENQARRNQRVESLLRQLPNAVVPKRGSDWDKASLAIDEPTSPGAMKSVKELIPDFDQQIKRYKALFMTEFSFNIQVNKEIRESIQNGSEEVGPLENLRIEIAKESENLFSLIGGDNFDGGAAVAGNLAKLDNIFGWAHVMNTKYVSLPLVILKEFKEKRRLDSKGLELLDQFDKDLFTGIPVDNGLYDKEAFIRRVVKLVEQLNAYTIDGKTPLEMVQQMTESEWKDLLSNNSHIGHGLLQFKTQPEVALIPEILTADDIILQEKVRMFMRPEDITILLKAFNNPQSTTENILERHLKNNDLKRTKILISTFNEDSQNNLRTAFYKYAWDENVDAPESDRRRGLYEKLFPDQPADAAMGAETAPGGIDFNSELLDLQIKRDGNGVPLPLPQQPIENMRIDGFFPVITTITPVRNVPALLGMLVPRE